MGGTPEVNNCLFSVKIATNYVTAHRAKATKELPPRGFVGIGSFDENWGWLRWEDYVYCVWSVYCSLCVGSLVLVLMMYLLFFIFVFLYIFHTHSLSLSKSLSLSLSLSLPLSISTYMLNRTTTWEFNLDQKPKEGKTIHFLSLFSLCSVYCYYHNEPFNFIFRNKFE